MLVLEIAGGVLLGLLLYRGLDSFCKSRNITMPVGVFLILWRLRFIGALILLVLAGIVLIPYVRNKHTRERVILTNDLPQGPPGYFYVREEQTVDANSLPCSYEKGIVFPTVILTILSG